MIILGITGSMGSGKTTLARGISKHFNAPSFDADAAAKKLSSPGSVAYEGLRKTFPDVWEEDGSMNKALRQQKIQDDAATLKKLQDILHPHVRRQEEAFIAAGKKANLPLIILDIPLLFETGAETLCTHTLCSHASEQTQLERIRSRAEKTGNSITMEQVKALVAQQMPQEEKRQKATAAINMEQDIQSAIQEATTLVSNWMEG